MRILNRTRGTLVGSRVEVADSWWSRLRGYLGRREPGPGEGLLLVPCRAVHTYGMGFPVDVIFLDPMGRVLAIFPEMEPWTRSPRVPGARYCLEVRAGTVDTTGTRVGDDLAWKTPRFATNGTHRRVQ